MTNRGQSQFLRIYDEAGTYARWQSYYINQTVTLAGQQWSYFAFVAEGFIGGSSGGNAGVSITVPATETAVFAFQDALNLNRLVELKVYEFNFYQGQDQPPASQVLIGAFVGEVTGITGTFSMLEIELGSGLAPVGAQAPPRKFNTRLIGVPLRI
jgi:hypothetical protein